MGKSYILEGTEDEYLVVIRLEDKKSIYNIIDFLYSSKNKEIQEIAVELEKSLHDNGRDTSKARSKNKSKSTNSNNSKRRKAKDT